MAAAVSAKQNAYEAHLPVGRKRVSAHGEPIEDIVERWIANHEPVPPGGKHLSERSGIIDYLGGMHLVQPERAGVPVPHAKHECRQGNSCNQKI